MKKKLFHMTIVLCFFFITCGNYKKIAGEYQYKNTKLVLKANGDCIYFNGKEKENASFKVFRNTLILMRDDHGNTIISTYKIDGNRLLGKTQHWKSGSQRVIYTRKK